MKNDFVQQLSKKWNACLCVVSLTATIAKNHAIVSCHEGTEVSTDAAAPVINGVSANAGIGVGVESFDKLALPKGKLACPSIGTFLCPLAFQ